MSFSLKGSAMLSSWVETGVRQEELECGRSSFRGTLSVPSGWASRRVKVPEGIPEGGRDLIGTASLTSRERGHETEV